MSPVSYIYQYASRTWSAMWRKRYGLAVLGFAVALLVVIGLLLTSAYRRHTDDAYDSALLAALWASYKQHDWNAASGRTVDAQNGNVTTSEGQAYTMLRAVWSNDRPTFDQTWKWTAAHLQRNDKLFSWRWGTLPDGTMGVITSEGGENTASDADIDTALALLMASDRWHDQQYHDLARDIVSAIWEQEVITVQGRPYLAADNLEKIGTSPAFLVNPSYVAPYAFRIFAQVDPAHDWNGLAGNSYELLQHVSTADLGGGASAGLPPDWVEADRHTGALSAPSDPSKTTDFGYDAFRVLWRVGLDWQWFHTPAATQVFKNFSVLNDQWTRQRILAAAYRRDGTPKVPYESLALYGGVLGYFKATNGGIASDIIRAKLRPLYDQAHNTLTTQLSYYDNNWVWFGLALYEDKLPNLAGQGSPA